MSRLSAWLTWSHPSPVNAFSTPVQALAARPRTWPPWQGMRRSSMRQTCRWRNSRGCASTRRGWASRASARSRQTCRPRTRRSAMTTMRCSSTRRVLDSASCDDTRKPSGASLARTRSSTLVSRRSYSDVLSARVRPGGRLVYSVCTFTAEESNQLTGEFASRNPRVHARGRVPDVASHGPRGRVLRGSFREGTVIGSGRAAPNADRPFDSVR